MSNIDALVNQYKRYALRSANSQHLLGAAPNGQPEVLRERHCPSFTLTAVFLRARSLCEA